MYGKATQNVLNGPPRIDRRAGKLVIGLLIASLGLVDSALGVKVGDLTRLKGSRRNTLVGFGLVTGLGKNGDKDYGPTARALAQLHSRFASPVTGMKELEEAGVAVVSLTAMLPKFGVREGDAVDVQVTALGTAKSIHGGHLLITPLVTPHRKDAQPYGFARGLVRAQDPDVLTVGLIKRGGILERDVIHTFVARGHELPYAETSEWVQKDESYLTLLIEDSHASFVLASTIAMTLNGWAQRPNGWDPNQGIRQRAQDDPLALREDLALAVDPRTVLVRVPRFELLNPVAFIDDLLQMPLVEEGAGEARVIVNRTKGTVVINGNVEISPVAISVRGISIVPAGLEGGQNGGGAVVAVDTKEPKNANLAALVESLNKLQVQPDVLIDIIEEIHRAGRLHGKLIRETD